MKRCERCCTPSRLKGILPSKKDIKKAFDLLDSCCDILNVESVSEEVFNTYMKICLTLTWPEEEE